VVEIGGTCVEYGHRLEPLDDHVLCIDCSQVAKQPALDGLDIDDVVTAIAVLDALIDVEGDSLMGGWWSTTLRRPPQNRCA